MTKRVTQGDLFLKLANPNKEGYSRWVDVEEFVGEFEELKKGVGNGLSWGRDDGNFGKKYKIGKERLGGKERGKIIRIRLEGFNDIKKGSQHIRKDIKDIIRQKRCVVLDTSKPEVDHKNGWKNDFAVMNSKTQKLDDFQPLSKAANDAKRQHCKECKQTGIRFDAKRLGYPISYTHGNQNHIGEATGCIGCFWYDPVNFRKHLKFTGN